MINQDKEHYIMSIAAFCHFCWYSPVRYTLDYIAERLCEYDGVQC